MALGARPHPPRALYRAYLDESDVFVGLYWKRYGWVAPAELQDGQIEPAGRLFTVAERGYRQVGFEPWRTDAEVHARVETDRIGSTHDAVICLDGRALRP